MMGNISSMQEPAESDTIVAEGANSTTMSAALEQARDAAEEANIVLRPGAVVSGFPSAHAVFVDAALDPSSDSDGQSSRLTRDFIRQLVEAYRPQSA